MKFVVPFASLVICLACSRPDRVQERVIGVKIYNYDGDFHQLFGEWQSLGINTVFTSPELDARPGFRGEAAKYGITRFLIIPIFYNPGALDADSALYAVTDQGKPAVSEWLRFVSPANATYRMRQIDRIRELIAVHNPDGLSLDFIRYFVLWEKVYPETRDDSLPDTSFDPESLAHFQSYTKISIPDTLVTVVQISEWIRSHHREEWISWKCSMITSMVRDITLEARKLKPDMTINVHIVPWRRGDFNGAIRKVAAQDIPELSRYCNYLSPMCYAHMLKREAGWVHEVVEDLAEQASPGTRILPSIQVQRSYLEREVTPDEFNDNLAAALATPSCGVIFWSWDGLRDAPEKKERIRTVLNR